MRKRRLDLLGKTLHLRSLVGLQSIKHWFFKKTQDCLECFLKIQILRPYPRPTE